MKKFALALVAVLMAAVMLTGCGSSTAAKVENGVISPNGTYTVEATLDGGSGKASIESPVTVNVKDGAMTATIVWSSSNYDLMVVDGTEYKPTTIKPGSTFEIPVKAVDAPLAVSAQTTAMGAPHMIDYTINFNLLRLRAK